MMSHRLFIVPRGHDRLYEDLRQQFSANPEVEVMVDRRDGERQQRRHSDRPDGREPMRDQGGFGASQPSNFALSASR